MTDPAISNASRRTGLMALGMAALMVACCVAGPVLLAVSGGLVLGTNFAPACAVLLLAACLVVGR